MRVQLHAGVALASLLGACATPSLVVDSRTGASVELDVAVAALADHDVVFLGENHDNAEGHRLQFEIVRRLHERRPRLAVSMEMFERDVQGDLDAYLGGKIDEATFLARSRPWKGYATYYRPIVEYAKAHRLPVLAANLPRDLAQKVSRQGPEAIAGVPHAPRTTTAAKDDYWQRFAAELTADPNQRDADWVFRFYQAQCAKDDAMAESIVDFLHADRAATPRPLVVHLCGRFHSDFGAGTVARVRARDAALRVGVFSMKAMPSVAANRLDAEARRSGDFILAVRGSEESEDEGDAPAHGPPAHAPAHAPAPAAAPAVAAAPAAGAEAPGGRPALGIMPDYSADGVVVQEVRAGGPAAQAGIQAGDVIVELAGQVVASVQEYSDVLGELRVGAKVQVVVLRHAERLEREVVVGSR